MIQISLDQKNLWARHVQRAIHALTEPNDVIGSKTPYSPRERDDIGHYSDETLREFYVSFDVPDTSRNTLVIPVYNYPSDETQNRIQQIIDLFKGSGIVVKGSFFKQSITGNSVPCISIDFSQAGFEENFGKWLLKHKEAIVRSMGPATAQESLQPIAKIDQMIARLPDGRPLDPQSATWLIEVNRKALNDLEARLGLEKTPQSSMAGPAEYTGKIPMAPRGLAT